MTQPREFYDNFVSKLLKDMLLGNPRIESAIIYASRTIQRMQRKSILDLGCGIGWSSYEFARAMPTSQVTGLDLSENLIQTANHIFPKSDNLDYECGDLTEEAWCHDREKKYDTCVMLDVYEHIPAESRDDFHKSLSKVLTDDGLILLTCPTKLHQDFLRENQPDGLQPVDEDITLSVIQEMADATSSEIIYFEYISIWATNDYLRAALVKNPVRTNRTKPPQPHQLISKEVRLEFAKRISF